MSSHARGGEPAEIDVQLRGGEVDHASQTVLTHAELNAHNTFDQPQTVIPRTSKLDQRGPSVRCVLPPASITRLDLRLT